MNDIYVFDRTAFPELGDMCVFKQNSKKPETNRMRVLYHPSLLLLL